MVRGIIASNKDRYSQTILDNLEKLAVGMETDQIIQPPKQQNDTFDEYWTNRYKQYLDNKTWQNVPFYQIESYLFRIILEIIEFNDSKS